MHFRRNIALAAGALVLAAPVLSSCGFNYATDRINTPSAGVNNRDKTVDVLSAVIVAGQPNSGTFIATLSNNSATKEISFTDLSGAEGNTVTADSFDPIKIAPAAAVNLATVGGVRLTGEFQAGNFVPVTVGFDNGESVTMDIPVVLACGRYEGLDEAPSASLSATSSASPSTEASPTEEATPYTCDDATPGGEG
jgi:hypothetical protein